jgi:hypothetical protein
MHADVNINKILVGNKCDLIANRVSLYISNFLLFFILSWFLMLLYDILLLLFIPFILWI